MRRLFWVLAIAGALGLALSSDRLNGQSMSKNLTGAPVTIEGMKSATAASWKAATPEKPEVARFIWPKSTASEASDGTLVVLPDLQGKDEENIEAWKKMFEPAKGKEFADDDVVIIKKKIGAIDITLLQVDGTYLKKSGASPTPEKMPKFRMYATIFDVKGKKYLIRAIGPKNTMIRNGSDFRAWLAAFK